MPFCQDYKKSMRSKSFIKDRRFPKEKIKNEPAPGVYDITKTHKNRSLSTFNAFVKADRKEDPLVTVQRKYKNLGPGKYAIKS